MRNVLKAVAITAALFALNFAVYFGVLFWLETPELGLDAALYLAPITGSGVIVIAAVCWFVYLGVRGFWRWGKKPGEVPLPLRKSKRLRVAIISLLLGTLGFFSALFFQAGCIGLMQRVEASRASATTTLITSIELASTKLLEDANQPNFRALLSSPDAQANGISPDIPWNIVMPELLRNGRNANVPAASKSLKLLGPGYLEVNGDGWGRPVVFSEPSPSEIVAVRSLGRDGVPSSDDILRDSKWGLGESEIYDPAAIDGTLLSRLLHFVRGKK